MEEEAPLVLRSAVGRKRSTQDLSEAVSAWIAPIGGVELELPLREPGREPPSFD